MNIGKEYNYDDNFVRMATIALTRVLTKRVRWINRWADGKKIRVVLPFYTSFAGQERFMLDAFVDDVASTRAELNTDQKQRGIVSFRGGSQRNDEFANPHEYLSKSSKINGEHKDVISRTMAVPITLSYDVTIKLDNEWEADTCYTKILDVLYTYFMFNINYYGIKIDAFFGLPAESGIDIPREINLGSDDTMSIKFSLDVNTYYPVFKISNDDFEICDNDDTIDWNFLDVKKPDGSDPASVDGALKRTYWYHNLLDNKSKDDLIREKEDNRNDEIDNME